MCLLVATAVLLSYYQAFGPLTWTLGFLAIFFAPGYAIVSALFPGQREVLSQSFLVRREERIFNISMTERIALSVGLSAAAMALAGTMLSRGIFDLTALTVGFTSAGFTYIFSAVAVYRRSRLPPGDQFRLATKTPFFRSHITPAEKAVSAAIVAGLVILGVVMANGLTAHPSPEPFSEVYMTGADGNMEHLPQKLTVGQQGLVNVTVTSHLEGPAKMTLVLSLEQNFTATSPFDPGQPVDLALDQPRSYQFDLANGQSWQRTLAFTLSTPGNSTVYLTLNDGSGVKQLWLPITVT